MEYTEMIHKIYENLASSFVKYREYYSKIFIPKKLLEDIMSHYKNLYNGKFEVEEGYILSADPFECYSRQCLYIDKFYYVDKYCEKGKYFIFIDADQWSEEIKKDWRMMVGYIHIHPPGFSSLSLRDLSGDHKKLWLEASFLAFPYLENFFQEIEGKSSLDNYFKLEKNVLTILGIISWDSEAQLSVFVNKQKSHLFKNTPHIKIYDTNSSSLENNREKIWEENK